MSYHRLCVTKTPSVTVLTPASGASVPPRASSHRHSKENRANAKTVRHLEDHSKESEKGRLG